MQGPACTRFLDALQASLHTELVICGDLGGSQSLSVSRVCDRLWLCSMHVAHAQGMSALWSLIGKQHEVTALSGVL